MITTPVLIRSPITADPVPDNLVYYRIIKEDLLDMEKVRELKKLKY